MPGSRDSRSRGERLSDLMGTRSGIEFFALCVAFGMLFIWFWLAMDIEDNAPRLWRAITFIVSLIPAIDAPAFIEQLDNLWKATIIAGIVGIIWLLAEYGHYLVKGALIVLGIYAVGVVAGPLVVIVGLIVWVIVMMVRSGDPSSGGSGKKGGVGGDESE